MSVIARFWSRRRGALLVTGLCAWALGIAALHRWSEGGPRPIKGAAKLLDRVQRVVEVAVPQPRRGSRLELIALKEEILSELGMPLAGG